MRRVPGCNSPHFHWEIAADVLTLLQKQLLSHVLHLVKCQFFPTCDVKEASVTAMLGIVAEGTERYIVKSILS